MEKRILREKAEFMKTFSHHIRLMILIELSKGARCVGDIEELLEVTQSNVSQHMAQLRRQGVVDFHEDGNIRCYYLTKPELVADLFAWITKDYPLIERAKDEVRKEGVRRKFLKNIKQKPLAELSREEIKEAVRIRYSEVADNPCANFNFPVGRAFAENVGYPKEVVDNLQPSFYESFTGAGNPLAYVDARKGEALLDLGCGAGLDLYFYAQKVGAEGKLFGLDISAGMIDKAEKNLQTAKITNCRFLQGSSDHITLPDNSVDIVTSNGIYNLSPDKKAVARDVFRILKPGGRTIFSEIILSAPLEKNARKNLDDWFRCIGGALTEKAFVALLTQVGFVDVKILSRSKIARTGHPLAQCANIRAEKPTT